MEGVVFIVTTSVLRRPCFFFALQKKEFQGYISSAMHWVPITPRLVSFAVYF